MKPSILITFILFTGLNLIPVIPALSQDQDIVIVRIEPPQPNQLSAVDLWRIELTSLASVPLEVFITGTIEAEPQGLVSEARSATVQLMPGVNRLTGRDVEPVTTTYTNSRYRDAVTRTGNFPAGDYFLCVTVYDAQGGRQGVRELGRDCLFHQVQPASPPILITPGTGDIVSIPYPNFTWTPPAPLPADGVVRYRIKIARVLRAQSPEVAVQSNLAWFETSNLIFNSLSYPPDARPFEEGTYAWYVEALGLRAGNVLAASEVEVFRWEPLQLEPLPATVATLAPHGIPAALFEALMRPCTGTPQEISIPGKVIESQSN
jgi:hypothetical protein